MEKTKKRIRSGEVVPALICVGLVLSLIVVSVRDKYREGDDWLVYAASLDKVAAEVNGQKLTLRDMAFYIVYDETVVEEQAELYDPEDTTKYWNLKTNNVFIRQLSKQNVMEKAIHDEIFYAMAVREEIELTSEDEIKLSEVQDMFWDNLMYGDKLERLGVTENDLNTSIRKIGLAQKCQAVYARAHQYEMDDLAAGGEVFEVMLSEQKYFVNDAVWDKVNYGDITLVHKNGIFQ